MARPSSAAFEIPRSTSDGRHPSGRIVPAIPHALGVSRPSKHQNKQSTSGEITDPIGVQQEAATEGETAAQDALEDAALLPEPVDVNATSTEPPPISMQEHVKETMADNLEVSPEAAGGNPDVAGLLTVAPRLQVGEEVTTSQPAHDLPPPFYPSQQSPGPAALPFHPTHQSHPSAGRSSNHSIVFGTQRGSNTSSPAPTTAQQPYNQHQHQQAPSQAIPSPHPTFEPIHAGMNGYNPSEVQTFHPQTHGYSPISRDMHRYGYQPQSRPQYVPSGRYGSRGRQFEHNFSSRYQPAMKLPQGAMYSDQMPQPFVPRGSDQTDTPYKPVNTDLTREGAGNVRSHRKHSLSPSDGQVQMDPRIPHTDESTILARYLCSQFGNAELADYLVQFSHSMYQFPPTSLAAHGVILARSPKLRSMMSMPNSASQNGLKILSVPVADRFLNVSGALMRALMRLYGETLPDRSDIARLSAPYVQLEGGSSEVAQMRCALAFAAAGHFLQVDEIISHALLLVGHMLSWTTITKALAFALDGGLSTAFTQLDAPPKDRESNSSSFDGPHGKPDSPASAPAYGFYSDRLLSHVMMFFIHNIPFGFKFSPSAPQLNDPPRLPAEAEPKHGRSTSRLSQIRFGDMALEGPSAYDPIHQAISSILVTLPFPLLRSAFSSSSLSERLGPPNAAEILREVVQEREIRRQRATTHRMAGAQTEEGVWRAVRWAESIEPTDRHVMGVQVTRSLAGTQTPTSTGSDKS